jgi:hypothetical protein
VGLQGSEVVFPHTLPSFPHVFIKSYTRASRSLQVLRHEHSAVLWGLAPP